MSVVVVTNLCRCCHSVGQFKSLRDPFKLSEKESFADTIRRIFNITIKPIPGESDDSYQICSLCETWLRNATVFKDTVLECEQTFLKLNHQKFLNIKNESSEDEEKIKIEMNDQSADAMDDGDLSDNEFWQSDSKDNTEAANSSFNEQKQETDSLCEEPVYIFVEEELETLDGSDKELENEDKPSDADETMASDQDSEEWLSDIKEDIELRISPSKIIPKNRICTICSEKFSNNDLLKSHMKVHTVETPNKCLLCDQIFTDNRELVEHIKEAHKVNNMFYCPKCPKIFKQLRLFTNHIDLCLRNNGNINKDENTSIKYFHHRCGWCSKTFETVERLDSHVLIHEEDKPYVCDKCGHSYRDKGALNKHIKKKHALVKPFKCDSCPKSFTSNYDLGVHKMKHSNDKPYQCKICMKSFKSSSTYHVHMRIHTGTKPYVCKFCGREFVYATSFIMHERIHSGKRPFQCKLCEKTFVSKWAFKIHYRVHSGEKPFECDMCQNRFSRRSLLKSHMAVHNGVEKYICEICSKPIADLAKHMKIHKGEKKYACQLCPKKFFMASALNVHMRVHTGEKPFKCDTCNLSYTQSSSLKNHKCLLANSVGPT